jgi:hypothetical protein
MSILRSTTFHKQDVFQLRLEDGGTYILSWTSHRDIVPVTKPMTDQGLRQALWNGSNLVHAFPLEDRKRLST